MGPTIQAIRRQLIRHARCHEYDRWRELSHIYADYLAHDLGDEPASIARRVKADTLRSPGLLWPLADEIPDVIPFTGESERARPGISDHQRNALRHAFTRPVCLLVGTPGTGKTHVLARVIYTLVRRYGAGRIAVCAPTGKAAVRMSSAIADICPGFRATTIHQLLEIGRDGHDGEGWGFQRSPSNPLDQRFVIVDEASMLDTTLAASLFAACGHGTHLLLVGDPYQLPPVGHGAPLRDLIAAGVPCGRLVEVRRNAGAIVEACAAIKDGKPPKVTQLLHLPTATVPAHENLVHVEVASEDEQVRYLSALAANRQPNEWQVICAVNEKTKLSRNQLNRTLQGRCNSRGEAEPYKPDDKVICLRNHYARSADGSGEYYLANGEQGQIAGVEGCYAFANFGDNRSIRVPIVTRRAAHEEEDEAATEGQQEDFALAYAITGHKSQGSEWPVVIIPLDSSAAARRVCTREWIYTAISRAKSLCVTIGRKAVLDQMAARPALTHRKTFLKERLDAERERERERGGDGGDGGDKQG